MAFPDDVLDEGEQVLADVRRHWWYLAGAVALLSVLIATSLWVAATSTAAWAGWLCVVALGVVVVWSLARYWRWSTTRLVVTNERLIDRSGVLARRVREIPIAALSDISYRQSLLQRMIGAGDLMIESAGKLSVEVFPDLPRPARVQREIYRQLARLHGGWPPPAGTAGVAASIPAQIEQLDRLRQQGILTEAEFESKKSELLGRL
jgi:membrane protein YdbS with pleckstrin-like domain